MKDFVRYDKEIGGDGAHASGAVGVAGDKLRLEFAGEMPLSKIVDPAMKVVDGLVDKLEQWIPGDQKAVATQLKAEARAELVKVLSE